MIVPPSIAYKTIVTTAKIHISVQTIHENREKKLNLRINDNQAYLYTLYNAVCAYRFCANSH